MAGQKVVLAGMVTDVRRIVTKKKGETMAFAVLEDVQGRVEVTVFPKTFKKTEAVWEPDRIVLVRGKVEMRDERPQVICDAAEEYGAEDRPAAAADGEEEALPAILSEKPPANGHARPNGNGGGRGPRRRRSPNRHAIMSTSPSLEPRTRPWPGSVCRPWTRYSSATPARTASACMSGTRKGTIASTCLDARVRLLPRAGQRDRRPTGTRHR